MALVKYIDLEDEQLTDNKDEFVFQLEKQPKYKDLGYSSLSAIVDIIYECIYGEAHQIDLELADENVKSFDSGEGILFNENDRKTEKTKRILSKLNEMETLINDPAKSVDLQDLKSRSIYYESFLSLFKHKQSIPTKDFAEEYNIPQEVVADDGAKLAAIAKEIFANIKQATSRSLMPQTMQDISKEEWADSVSGSKYAKARALEKIKTVQQLESQIDVQKLKTSAKFVSFNLEIDQNERHLVNGTSVSNKAVEKRALEKSESSQSESKRIAPSESESNFKVLNSKELLSARMSYVQNLLKKKNDLLKQGAQNSRSSS